MAHTPTSRKSSFAAPSRLTLPPTLRPSPSLSNFRAHSHGSSPPHEALAAATKSKELALDSSASSMVNMDMAEGILIQETDSSVDPLGSEDHVSVSAQLDQPMSNADSKQLLREQLKRSLSNRPQQPESSEAARLRGKHAAMNEVVLNAASRYRPREYFILTDAGKPVFVSRPGNEDQDNTASVIGVMQALISVFIDDGDKIRCINAGPTRITFLQRSPLYYVCVSSWGEPESTTRAHLEYLHLQILSIVTASQLKRIFERRTNFDLRRLLNGAEPFMNSMLERVESDLAMTMSSLGSLKLDPGLRKKIAETIMPSSKIKDILYIIVVAQDRVLTLIRPRKHSIHPADLHIILNTINTPSVYNNPAASSCIPFCLPKFRPNGFVNAYVSFIRTDDYQGPSRPVSPSPSSGSEGDEVSHEPSKPPGLNDFGVALVCITASQDFESVRTWGDNAIKKLAVEGTLRSLLHSFRAGQTEYSASELGIPGLRHFVYKSRAQVQTTSPIFEDPYDKQSDRRRLVTLYQLIHDAIHARSGQEAPLKLQYVRTEHECVMGWITQPFELYVAVSPMLPKTAVVGAANSVTRWIKKEESRLFLRDAPVF
ncbi:vacuolar fusion protein MON1 [Coprinopsis cinerea AmutBmut pab1-1]|nr:vacuolar fusion protein MON1 [Coprinopsis cinerea AmutBmut pab1-1]